MRRSPRQSPEERETDKRADGIRSLGAVLIMAAVIDIVVGLG
jgi:hypothetical protein